MFKIDFGFNTGWSMTICKFFFSKKYVPLIYYQLIENFPINKARIGDHPDPIHHDYQQAPMNRSSVFYELIPNIFKNGY